MSHDEIHKPSDLASVESVWESSRTRLENEYQRIYEEIKSYPRPIPACDLQFNQLLEERDRIRRELDRMHEVS
jgi:uncharacterized coiled-coil DUF342 family protein